jgi:hypothetical protein
MPVLLIAGNLVRENRWPLLMLSAWPFFIAAIAFDERENPEDYLFILSTLFVYGLAFVLFIGSAAIHNERKTRRILAVLSKGVERGEYLAGIILGTMAMAAIYGLALGLANSALVGRAGLWAAILVMMVAALLGASVAVFFTTFLPPLFALLASGFALGAPILLERWLALPAARALPVYPLLAAAIQAVPAPESALEAWPMMALAVAEALALWWAASVIFGRRDIAVAIE